MSGDADVGAADTLLPGPEQRLGRYHLRASVGAGAMGVVHLAHDPQLDRRVAIKVLHARHVLTVGAADRLLREAKAMARLRHPNVVAVYDAGTDGDRVYVVMELIGGATLGEVLRERTDAERADWRRWLPLLVDAGRGLAAAHAAGILHRDFKPDNVLVDTDGRVCVGDFGLADVAGGVVTTERATAAAAPAPTADAFALDETAVQSSSDPGARLTTTGAVMGTPAYMAPEQLIGRNIDARADQVSLCVAMFEALAGHRPFEIGEPGQLAALPQLRDEIVAGRIGSLPATVPRWLAAAVRRGLAADPERRWPTIDALLAHIERRLRTPRRKPLIAGLTAIVLAGGGAAAWIAWPSRSPPTGASLPALGSPRRLAAPPTTQAIAVAGDRLLVWTDRRVTVRTLVAGSTRDERSYDVDDATTVTCATLGPDGRALVVLASEPGMWQATWWRPEDGALEPVLDGARDRDVVGCVAGHDGAIGLLDARPDGTHALVWGDRAGERWRLDVPGAYADDFELATSPDRRRSS